MNETKSYSELRSIRGKMLFGAKSYSELNPIRSKMLFGGESRLKNYIYGYFVYGPIAAILSIGVIWTLWLCFETTM